MIHIDSVFAMLFKIPFNVCTDKWVENPSFNPNKIWTSFDGQSVGPQFILQDNCKSSLRMIEYRDYM